MMVTQDRALGLKRHFAVRGSAACECHDVMAVQLTTNPWNVDCLRCARTRVWRDAAGVPIATTDGQAAAMLKYGRQARFLAWPPDEENGSVVRRYELMVGRKVIWRKQVWGEHAAGPVRAEAVTWAAAHGFSVI